MRRVISYLATVAALSAAVAVPAAAQGGGMRQGGFRAPDHWLTMDSLVTAVGVTDQQKADVQKHFDAIQAVFKKAVEQRQKMREQFQSGARPSQEQMQQMRTDMENLQKEADTHYNELRAMLSADQQAKLDALPKPEVAMRRGMRGGGGGRR